MELKQSPIYVQKLRHQFIKSGETYADLMEWPPQFQEEFMKAWKVVDLIIINMTITE